MASEFERRYSTNAHPGTIRFLTYLNQGRFGSYQAALSVPGVDISQARAYRHRDGFGLNWGTRNYQEHRVVFANWLE